MKITYNKIFVQSVYLNGWTNSYIIRVHSAKIYVEKIQIVQLNIKEKKQVKTKKKYRIFKHKQTHTQTNNNK